MSGVVLDDINASGVSDKTPESIIIDNIVPNGVVVNDHAYNVTQSGQSVDLSFSDISGIGEMYLQFGKLVYLDPNTSMITVEAELLKDGQVVQNSRRGVVCPTKNSHMYGGRENWLINFGYNDNDINGIRIYFNTIGNYEINDIKVYFENDETIQNNVNDLIHPDDGISINRNELSTNLNIDKDGYCLITLPYSEGWKAILDGKEVELLQADEAFMALKVNSGNHTLIMRYRTPLLYEGLLGTLVLVLIGCVIVYVQKKRTMHVNME